MSQDKPRRYRAYYFGFVETGDPAIDKILSAICFAGKGYHHTQDWVEMIDDYGDYTGGSYEEWIQGSANEAAKEITKLKEALREAVGLIERGGNIICDHASGHTVWLQDAEAFESKHAAIIAEITKGEA